jgi:hypothetical protein
MKKLYNKLEIHGDSPFSDLLISLRSHTNKYYNNTFPTERNTVDAIYKGIPTSIEDAIVRSLLKGINK